MATIRPWADFLDHLLPAVPGCVPAMAYVELRHAVREFCERTRVWDVWLEPVLTNALCREYEFEVERTQEVVKLLGATLDGHALPVLAANDLPAGWMDRPQLCQRGVVTLDRRVVHVLPGGGGVADGQSLRMRVALRPSMKATGVEERIFEQYVEDICLGAKARLMLSPKKPYTSLELAAVHRADFDARCHAVARQVEHSFSRAPRRTRAMFF